MVLDPAGPFRRTGRTLTISTDGSTSKQGRRRGKDQGPGGWAYIVHETGVERGGHVAIATNNRMELIAVIEAIKSISDNASAIIRTDSLYVHDAINRRATLKTNIDLWKQFVEIRQTRKLKFEWVKGHAGDPHNERADRLASDQAQLVQELKSSTSVE